MKRTFVFLLLCAAGMAGAAGLASAAGLAAAAAQAAGAQPAPDAPAARTVYLLPMSHGLEQFLANHLATSGAMQVVTDPRYADAVLADAIGPAFESRMKVLFPPEEPPPAPASEASAGDEGAERVRALAKAPPAGGTSSFGRGRGNIFLVDVQSRQVLWSTFEKPEGAAAEELDRAASKIVARLGKDMPRIRPPAAKRSPSPAPPTPAPKK
jgi:hypothetical protein